MRAFDFSPAPRRRTDTVLTMAAGVRIARDGGPI
jgi:hypothetical protein